MAVGAIDQGHTTVGGVLAFSNTAGLGLVVVFVGAEDSVAGLF